MDQANPAMISLAREARGWKQEHLADALNVNQSTVSRYELGATPPSRDHVTAIAAALRFEEAFFYQRTPAVGLGGDFLYRRRVSVSADNRKRVEAEANIRRMQVEQLLKGAVVYERFPFPTIPLDEVGGRPDRAAIELRKAWRVPDGPIHNLTDYIESAGGVVFLTEFGTDLIDGTNLRLPGLPPLMFLNKNVPGERHRFNLGHELGHLVMHFGVAIGDAEEQANTFAHEFLMPRAQIKSDLRNLDLAAALRLKGFWKVSMAAIIMRAKVLKVISPSRASKLFAAMNARGQRTREPNPLEMEKPKVFDSLIDAHLNRVGLSAEDLNRILYTDKLGPLPLPGKRPDSQLKLVGF